MVTKGASQLKLSTQVTITISCVVLILFLAIGEFTKRAEQDRLSTDLEDRAEITTSLIGALMIEAIIVEDVPLLNTAISETMAQIPAVQYVAIHNEAGVLLTQFPNTPPPLSDTNIAFDKNIEFEGENFGHMTLYWSTVQGQLQIKESVARSRLYAFGALALLAISCLIAIRRLVLNPLSNIHMRLNAIFGELIDKEIHPLPKRSAHEFWTLSSSVDTLQTTLNERDEREQALERARIDADAANRAKSEFLANMSHEIRTPMNGVIGMAQLLQETELDTDQSLYADTIEKSGSALVCIINDILDYSKIDAGRMELTEAPFNLMHALEDSVTLLSAQASKNNVEVALNYPAHLPTCFVGDVGRLKQIIMNIAGNAVKFTLQGHVAITVSGQVLDETCRLKISILDTGVGIPKTDLQSIFSAFEQVNSATNRQFEGTGLGLAISSRLISLMNGKISVSSEVGKGSIFDITMSFPTSEENIGRPEPASILQLKDTHILIVDDLEVNRTVIEQRAISWGATFESASNAHQALEKIKTQDKAFDLAILDYQMPDTDGIELAKSIKAATQNQLPMILCSSVDMMPELNEVEAALFTDIMQKPVRSEQLIHRVQNAIKAKITTNPLPTSKPSKPVAKKAAPVTNGGFDILVAEDNKTNQLVIKGMTKTANASIRFANNGQEALDAFAAQRPDLVLMDLSMPVMDGLSATKAIREFEAQQNAGRCPIVALTANAMKGDREMCLDAGMDDYLTKPVKKAILFETLAHWLDDTIATDPPKASSKVA